MDTSILDKLEEDDHSEHCYYIAQEEKTPQNRKNGFIKFWKSSIHLIDPDFSPPVYKVYTVDIVYTG